MVAHRGEPFLPDSRVGAYQAGYHHGKVELDLLKVVRGKALARFGRLGINAAMLRIEDEDVAVLALGWTLQLQNPTS